MKIIHSKVIIFYLILLIIQLQLLPLILGNNTQPSNSIYRIDTDFDALFDHYQKSSSPSLTISPEDHSSFTFQKVWESQTAEGLWDVTIGEIDNDEFKDICIPVYESSNAILTIYENTADNNFTEIYRSNPLGYGVINAMEIADVDQNGHNELLAGHYKTKLRLFESDGDNSYIQQTFIDIGASPFFFKDIEVADANNNGINEIIIIKNDPAGSTGYWGYLSIWEDMEKIFELQSYSYYSGVTVGNLDQDEYLDIIITHGGWGFEEFWVDH